MDPEHSTKQATQQATTNETPQGVTEMVQSQTAKNGEQTFGGQEQSSQDAGQRSFEDQQIMFQGKGTKRVTGEDGEEAGDDVAGGNEQAGAVTPSKVESTFNFTEKKAMATTQEPRLLDQLKTGFSENLESGKNEFIMKLKPEALGEITVRLVHEEGKSTLHIMTASAKTSQLINEDLAALRESVRPMQIEVREAVASTAQSEQGQMEHFNMSGQQFADQQQNFTNNAKRSNYRDDGSEEDLLQNEQTEQISAPSGERRIYI